MALSRSWLVANLCLAGLLVLGSGSAEAQRARAAKRTGVIATIGPKSGSVQKIRKMIRAGAGVARVNLSHNNARSLNKLVPSITKAAKLEGRKIPLLADLPGGKVRIGLMGAKPVMLTKGQSFDLVVGKPVRTTKTQASVAYKQLGKHAKKGDTLLLDDGNIALEVTSVGAGKIRTKVIKAGGVRARMGLAIKGKELPFPSMTAQDRRKLKLAVEHGADWIGVSMVQSPRNLQAVRKALDKMGKQNVKIVAKIESVSAMANLEAIVDHSDMIMIARGDLSTAVGRANLAQAQAQIAKVATARGKSFINATGFMSNMIEKSAPSAANKADVKSALKQGPTWFMLNETAIGKYPVETVKELQAMIKADRTSL